MILWSCGVWGSGLFWFYKYLNLIDRCWATHEGPSDSCPDKWSFLPTGPGQTLRTEWPTGGCVVHIPASSGRPRTPPDYERHLQRVNKKCMQNVAQKCLYDMIYLYSQVIKGWNRNSGSTYGYGFNPLSLDCMCDFILQTHSLRHKGANYKFEHTVGDRSY